MGSSHTAPAPERRDNAATGARMTLQRGDHLKRDGVYVTILSISPCGRYAVVAWAKGTRIVEERIAIKGLRKGRYNVTQHAHRCYKGVLVIEP